MNKITINGVEFTEKEIEAIEEEYNDLLQEVVQIELRTGLDMHGTILGGAKKDMETVLRYKKIKKIKNKIDKELESNSEIFKEQLEMKIIEALEENK